MNLKLSMVFAAVLGVFLFSGYAKAEPPVSETDRLIEKCRHLNKAACIEILPKLKFQKSSLTFELARGLCLSMNEMCDEVLHTGLYVGVKPDAKLVNHINQLCTETPGDICSRLGEFYMNSRDYKNAIAVTKKQFVKLKSGLYPHYEYTYGRRERGFKAALIACRHNNEECGLAGLYLYRKGEYAQAADVFMSSCHGEQQSGCVYLLGLPSSPVETQVKALRLYCGVDRENADPTRRPAARLVEAPLDCQDVTADTQAVSNENATKASDFLKSLDKNLGNPN